MDFNEEISQSKELSEQPMDFAKAPNRLSQIIMSVIKIGAAIPPGNGFI